MMKEAVALEYKEGMIAPKVIAKAKGYQAEALIALAKKFGIPIEENELLVSGLQSLELDQCIPEKWYQLVAELLAFLQKENKSGYN
jgi:flagellar biosynthesis protein